MKEGMIMWSHQTHNMSYQTNTKVQTFWEMPQKEKQKAFLQHLNISLTILQSQSKQVVQLH